MTVELFRVYLNRVQTDSGIHTTGLLGSPSTGIRLMPTRSWPFVKLSNTQQVTNRTHPRSLSLPRPASTSMVSRVLHSSNRSLRQV